MTPQVHDPEAATLFELFFELSKIPRGSGNEAAAMRWVKKLCDRPGLEVIQDHAGNVLIRKGATPGMEARPGICLQAHVDKVCAKEAASKHDFLTDPIPVQMVGDLVKAHGTTLATLRQWHRRGRGSGGGDVDRHPPRAARTAHHCR